MQEMALAGQLSATFYLCPNRMACTKSFTGRVELNKHLRAELLTPDSLNIIPTAPAPATSETIYCLKCRMVNSSLCWTGISLERALGGGILL